jgi:hypothetical protein
MCPKIFTGFISCLLSSISTALILDGYSIILNILSAASLAFPISGPIDEAVPA